MTAPEPVVCGFRGPEAVRLAGITYRQLDYWARTGLVEPSVRPAHGSGTQRLYSRLDVVRLAVVRRLLVDVGMSLDMIRRSLDPLLASYEHFGDPATLLLADDARLELRLAPLFDSVPEPPGTEAAPAAPGLALVR